LHRSSIEIPETHKEDKEEKDPLTLSSYLTKAQRNSESGRLMQQQLQNPKNQDDDATTRSSTSAL